MISDCNALQYSREKAIYYFAPRKLWTCSAKNWTDRAKLTFDTGNGSKFVTFVFNFFKKTKFSLSGTITFGQKKFLSCPKLKEEPCPIDKKFISLTTLESHSESILEKYHRGDIGTYRGKFERFFRESQRLFAKLRSKSRHARRCTLYLESKEIDRLSRDEHTWRCRHKADDTVDFFLDSYQWCNIPLLSPLRHERQFHRETSKKWFELLAIEELFEFSFFWKHVDIVDGTIMLKFARRSIKNYEKRCS